jgi:enterochelin esterase-like enzyme
MTDVKPDLGQSLQLQALEQLAGLSREVSIVQGQNNIIIKEQERAAAGRAVMHDKLNKIDALSQVVERIAPLVDAHEKTAQQAIGALVIGRVLWGLLAGAAGAAATIFFGWLSGIRPPPPH